MKRNGRGTSKGRKETKDKKRKGKTRLRKEKD